jgi:hypothetical protein
VISYVQYQLNTSHISPSDQENASASNTILILKVIYKNQPVQGVVLFMVEY